jgi:hypothetical protein
MGILAVYEAIETALEQGEEDALTGRSPRKVFEFPNELRAYIEGYKIGTKKRDGTGGGKIVVPGS